MKVFRIVITVCCFYFAFSGSSIFSQSGEKSKDQLISSQTEKKRRDRKQIEIGDPFPKKEIKSPFRFIVVDDDVQFSSEEGQEEVPVRRFVKVLMEERAFNKANLIYLFNFLSNAFGKPAFLDIEVHTSLMTLETPEEGAVMSTHTSRDDFRRFHRTATYSRSNDIDEGCIAGFLYDMGKPGNFVTTHVNLTCTTTSPTRD